MNPPTITLLAFGHFDKALLESISIGVKLEFDCAVAIKDAHVDIGEFYDPGRRQYNGDKLLKAISSIDNPNSLKVIGLFNVDLFIPILTYIFGQAQLGGRLGIASLYRLGNEGYGMKTDEKSLFIRFGKEVVHELGHTFGLVHCHVPTCVMRSSTYVEDIDQKEAHLCAKCRAAIGAI